MNERKKSCFFFLYYVPLNSKGSFTILEQNSELISDIDLQAVEDEDNENAEVVGLEVVYIADKAAGEAR